MSRYASIDEEKIRTQSSVRAWNSSGFVDEAQANRIREALRVDLRRTNLFLRVVLFVFTVLITAASIGLFVVTFDIDDAGPGALTCLVSAAICYSLAEYVVRRFRLYRFGIEEALAMSAVLLLGIGTLAAIDHFGRGGSQRMFAAALGTAAAGALGVYLRFGYLYAALGFVASLAALPFQFDLTLPMERGLVGLILLGTFVVVRSKKSFYGDDFPGDDYGWLQAAALAGLYLDLNLRITASAAAPGNFYGLTYALVWVIPVVFLIIALSDRDRTLLNVSIAALLLTILTNKSYLGLSQQPWDPIVFGVFLSAIAMMIRRWLAKSPDGEWHGFTAKRLLSTDKRLLAVAGTAAAVLQSGSDVASHTAAASKPDFQGGRSGGAGASGSF
jgi:hypothetical protein